MPTKEWVHDGLKLSDAERARCAAIARSMAVALKYDDPQRDVTVNAIFPADAAEEVKVVEHLYCTKKDAPVGMPKQRKIIQLNDYFFDSWTGGLVQPETLNLFYLGHEAHKRQWPVTEFDLIVLLAISSRGAENIYQIEQELAGRVRPGGIVYFLEREHIIEACTRLKNAQVWLIGELPKPREERVARKAH